MPDVSCWPREVQGHRALDGGSRGVVAKADDGSYYDRFRGRIIFPVRDAAGAGHHAGGPGDGPQCAGEVPERPETEIFDKGGTSTTMAPRARRREGQAADRGRGYMDVIALSEAGFGGAVAPMGTAVTEDHCA